MFICDRVTGTQQFRRLNERKSITDVPDGTNLSFHLSGMIIPDDRGYLRFRVFISRQNLGQS